MTTNKYARLYEPFYSDEIEWRIQSCGKSNGKIWAICLAYIQSRAVMNRLDEVFGVDNWSDDYQFIGSDVVCKLSIWNGSMWITKTDGAPQTEIEAWKGGISDALKRAAVKFGVGRYLYKLEASFAEITPNGKYRGKTQEKETYRWNPPRLPDWALPEDELKNIKKSAPKQTKLIEEENIEEEVAEDLFGERGPLERLKEDLKNMTTVEQLEKYYVENKYNIGTEGIILFKNRKQEILDIINKKEAELNA